MAIEQFLTWVEELDIAVAVRESSWLFPAAESVHVLGLVLVVGTIAMLDLRLLGWSSAKRSITQLSAELLPWTWWAFAVTVIAGLLLFTSKALEYYENTPFRIKMICLALAGVNMLVFHFFTFRDIARWDNGTPPASARVAGALSLGLWIVIVATGRWIGFV